MAVSIPKRYRPAVVRQGPGVYYVQWMGLTICTAETRSQGKAVAKALMRLLLPLAKCSNVNMSGVTLAYYMWLLAASLPTSGISPPIIPSTPVVIPAPPTVRARLALRTLQVSDRSPPLSIALPQVDVMRMPDGGPDLLRVPDPSPTGGDFGAAPTFAAGDPAAAVRAAGLAAFYAWYFRQPRPESVNRLLLDPTFRGPGSPFP